MATTVNNCHHFQWNMWDLCLTCSLSDPDLLMCEEPQCHLPDFLMELAVFVRWCHTHSHFQTKQTSMQALPRTEIIIGLNIHSYDFSSISIAYKGDFLGWLCHQFLSPTVVQLVFCEIKHFMTPCWASSLMYTRLLAYCISQRYFRINASPGWVCHNMKKSFCQCLKEVWGESSDLGGEFGHCTIPLQLLACTQSICDALHLHTKHSCFLPGLARFKKGFLYPTWIWYMNKT